MKRMWNVAALGAVVIIGLGTFAIDSKASTAEWVLDVKTNESVWENQKIQAFYETEDEVQERFEITRSGSEVTTHLNYVEEALKQRERVNPTMRKFYRQMTNLSFTQSLRTKEEYVGIGQKGNDEIVLFRTEGNDIATTTFPSNVSGAVEVMEGNWHGIFVQDGRVHLIYRDGYDRQAATKIAVFDEGAAEITLEEISIEDGFIASVVGTSRFYDENRMTIAADNRFLPVRLGTYETITEDGQTYTNETERPGVYAYDTEEKRVVELKAEGDMWGATVYEDQLIVLQEDGTEFVVDLKTEKQSTRQVIDGSVGTTWYVDNQLYHIRPTKDGAVIDVYQDGKAISSAVVKATNDEAKALLPSTQFYVE